MRRFLSIVALLPLAGCPLFSVDAELGEMCVTFKDRVISGVAPGDPYRESIVSDPLSEFGAFFELDGKITGARAKLIAKSTEDLSFLESVRVSLRGIEPGAELPPTWLSHCDDWACASTTKEADIAASVPEDVMDYVAAGKVQVDVTLAGPLPSTEWTVDVEVCISGEVSLDLSL